MGHIQFPCHLHGDRRPLEILLVGPEDEHEDVRDGDRQQRLLAQSGMGVDEKEIESEMIAEVLNAIAEQADVVAFAQDLGDLAGLDAGGDQVQAALVSGDFRYGNVIGGIGDGACPHR